MCLYSYADSYNDGVGISLVDDLKEKFKDKEAINSMFYNDLCINIIKGNIP